MPIKKFHQFISESKTVYSLDLIEPGTQVSYHGNRYFVIDSNEFAMELSKDKDALPGDRKNLLVNKNMFAEMGSIPEQE